MGFSVITQNVPLLWPSDPDGVLCVENRAVWCDRTSLPIILLVELKELTSSVGRKKAVVHVQRRLEGDECGVVLGREANITATLCKGTQGCETAVCSVDYMHIIAELTAEYIMNLRGLPCSTTLEKFFRMAFSRTPGKTSVSAVQIQFCQTPARPV